MLHNKNKACDTFDINSTKENLDYALTKHRINDNEEFRLKYNYEKKLTSNLKHNSKGVFIAI